MGIKSILVILIFLLLVQLTKADSPQPKILLVKDAHWDPARTNDDWGMQNIAPYYTATLDSLGLTYDTCTVDDPTKKGPGYDVTGGCTEPVMMKNYDIVIWFTGNDGRGTVEETLTSFDRNATTYFLDNGGKLFISGQDIGKECYSLWSPGAGSVGCSGNPFYANYLHAYYCKDASLDNTTTGAVKDPIGNGLLPDIGGGAGNQLYPSVIFTYIYPYAYVASEDLAYVIGNSFYYGTALQKSPARYYVYCEGYPVEKDFPFVLPGAVRNHTTGPLGRKVVYFAFGLEGVADNSTRTETMKRIYYYFGGPKVTGTKVYRRNLGNTSWEEGNLTCSPSDAYCLRKLSPLINATCIENQLFANVTGGEYFINDTEPARSQYQTGSQLFASDGAFNSSEERVNNTINLPANDGTYKAWVHCNNTDNYYGKFDTAIFILDKIPPYFTATKAVVIEDEKAFTNMTKPKIVINYPTESLKPEYMALSCNVSASWQNDVSWSEWTPYSLPYYGFNITNSTLSCPSEDGNRTIIVKIRDDAGNVYPGVASSWIVLDRVPPRIINIIPQNNYYLKSSDTITITFYDPSCGVDSTCSNINTSIYYNETHYNSFSNNTPFNPGWSSEGLHTLIIYINDSAGNLNITTYQFTVDNTPPSISIDSPQAGKIYSGIVNILTTISDILSSVDKALYEIKNSTNVSQVFASGELLASQGWDTVWNSSANISTAENVTLTIYANDTVGNSVNANINFTVDNTKPSITIVYPRATYLNKNFNLDIRAAVGNPSTANLTNATYYIFNSSEIVANNTTTVNKPSFNFTDSIGISSWADGNYTINASAYDTQGKLATDVSWFYIDRAPPVAWNYRTDVENDTTFNDFRVYPNTQITFSVNVSEAVTKVDKVLVTVNSSQGEQNFTLEPISQNLKNDTWKFTYTPSLLGYYNFSKIYANDTIGNMFSDWINISVLVVNGSAYVSLDSSSEIDAGRNATLNLTFYFNKTFTTPSILIYVPPNSPTNSNQTPNYFNVSAYACNNCSLSYKYDSQSNITVVNVTSLVNVTTLNLSVVTKAGTPSIDTNDAWIFSFMGISYTNSTKIKTPFLNITRIFCDNSVECLVEPSKPFNLTVEINNVQTGTHTGKAYNVFAWFKDSLTNSTAIGNMSSGDVSNTTWTGIVLNTTGNYTFTFGAWEQTKQYNATPKSFVIQVKDVAPPNMSSPRWKEDNIINVNETTAYYVEVSDNVGISQVWATINQSTGYMENKTLTLDQRYISYDVWKLAYNNTSWTGNYSILNIFANDTSNNVGNLTPTGNAAWFEVRELAISSSVAFGSLIINNIQTVYTNITGNASAIEDVLVNISKPRGFYESISLSFKNISNVTYIFEGNYTNITRSGNYSLSINVSLSSGISKSSTTNFSVPYGNVSIGFDWPILYLTNTTGKYNLTFYVIPDGGDLTSVNGSLWINDTSVISLVSGQNQSFGNISWEGGEKPIKWEVNVSNLGSTNVTLWINSTTPSAGQNASKTINVTIIPNDTDAPVIRYFGHQWNSTNLMETNNIWVNATDLATVVDKVLVEVSYPSGGKENLTASRTKKDFYELVFSNTNETGNFSYKIFVTDIANNTNETGPKNFTVVNTYQVEVSTDSTIYNKGNMVLMSVKVKNVNGLEVNDFNLTLILNKNSTSENETLINNSVTDSGNYSIIGDDPPLIVDPNIEVPAATYHVFANVNKNGNSGYAGNNFLVSPYLDLELLTSPSGYVSPDNPINISVTLKNKKGDVIGEGASVIAFCTYEGKSCPGISSVGLRPSYAGTYESLGLIKAPNVKEFSISIAAVYAGNKDPAGPAPYVILSTYQPTPTTQPAAPGGAPAGVCNCTDWSNVACGAGACTESELYQTRVCTPAGCAEESRCIEHPACKEKIDFEFTLSEVRISLQQGLNTTVSGSIKNTGSKPITVRTSLEKSCCEVKLPESFYVDVKGEVGFLLEVHVSLSTIPGEYPAKLRMEAANLTKEKSFVITVEKNQMINLIEGYEKGLDILEADIAEYKKSGVDASELDRLLANARKAVQTAKEAVSNDDLEGLEKAVNEVGRNIDKINSMLFGFRLQKFLYENKWNIAATVIVVIVLIYTGVEIIVPFYKFSSEIKRLEFEKTSLMNSRIETEKQFFMRKIDEKTFRAIIAEKQSQLYKITASINLEKEERRKLVLVKLNPLSFFRWVSRVAKGLWKKKEIVGK